MIRSGERGQRDRVESGATHGPVNGIDDLGPVPLPNRAIEKTGLTESTTTGTSPRHLETEPVEDNLHVGGDAPAGLVIPQGVHGPPGRNLLVRLPHDEPSRYRIGKSRISPWYERKREMVKGDEGLNVCFDDDDIAETVEVGLDVEMVLGGIASGSDFIDVIQEKQNGQGNGKSDLRSKK